MAEGLQNMFPQKPDKEEDSESKVENEAESIPDQENMETQKEDQVQENTEKAEPELDVAGEQQRDQQQLEQARNNLDQAYGLDGTEKAEHNAGTEQPEMTGQTPKAEPNLELQANEEEPADKLQAMADRAKKQYDSDMGADQIPTAETTPEEEPEKAQEIAKEEVQQADAENEIVMAAEALQDDVEDVEMTPEMKEYVEDAKKRMEEEFAGMEDLESAEQGEKKERPKRSALKKAMLVVTAAAALWMFQATVAPDNAAAKSKQTQIEKFEKKQKRRINKTKKRIEKMPGKLTKGVMKDVQRGINKGINGVTKDIIKGIGGIFK